MTTKQCRKCGEVKPDKDFPKTVSAPCKVCQSAYQRAYRLANKEKIAAYSVTPDKKAEYNRSYYEKNRARFAARDLKKETLRTQCIPAWADKKRIQSYYNVCGFFNKINGYIKYHVDHIIPLQGKNVSGLHVHQNLRVILAAENISKKNKFEI